jgi:hypothetical protein
MESSNGKPPQGKEEGKAAEGSIGGYESLHRLLQSNLSPELFKVRITRSVVWLSEFGNMFVKMKNDLEEPDELLEKKKYSWLSR